FQACLQRAGIERRPAHTAHELLHALLQRRPAPALAQAAAGFVACYERARFGAAPGAGASQMRQHLHMVQRLCRRR
ncbi:MAG: DUF4129 domain-containing protein, partial [Terriglobales bacterium]